MYSRCSLFALLVLLFIYIHSSFGQTVTTGAWTQLLATTAGPIPPIQYAANLVSRGTGIYLFGAQWDLPTPGTYPWVNSLWSLDLSYLQVPGTPETSWVELRNNADFTALTGPQPQRWFATSLLVRGDEFWIVTGLTTSTTWPRSFTIYDIATDTLTFRAQAAAPIPLQSQSISFTAIDTSNYIYFGGCGNPAAPDFPNYNQMWLYDENANDWSDLNVKDRIVGPNGTVGNSSVAGIELLGRCGHIAHLVNGIDPNTNLTKRYIYIWGGHSSMGVTEQLWKYDVDLNQIEPITPDRRPQGRSYTASEVVGNIIFIFAGNPDAREFARDMWALDTTRDKWVQIDLTGQTIPLARAHTSMTYVQPLNALVLYGGLAHLPNGNNFYLDDTWIFGIGCPNTCSNHGQCLSFTVCDCDLCWGGTDCSTRINNDPSCVTNVVIGSTSEDTGSVGALVGSLIGAIVGALLLCCCLACLFATLAILLFRRWKKKKAAAGA